MEQSNTQASAERVARMYEVRKLRDNVVNRHLKSGKPASK